MALAYSVDGVAEERFRNRCSAVMTVLTFRRTTTSSVLCERKRQ
jgi:hypothetical protein